MPTAFTTRLLLLSLFGGYRNYGACAFERYRPPPSIAMSRTLRPSSLSTTRIHQTSPTEAEDDRLGKVLAQVMMSSSSEDQPMFNIVEVFVGALNAGNFNMAMACCTNDVEYVNMKFSKPFDRTALERHLRLRLPQWAIETVIRSGNSVAMQFCNEEGLRKHAFFHLDEKAGKICCAWEWEEPVKKRGRDTLDLLTKASKVLDVMGGDGSNVDKLPEKDPTKLTVPEKYYIAWNRRDIGGAVDLFAKGCLYEDTVFDAPLMGTRQVKNHLQICAGSFPSTFRFVVDEAVTSADKVALRWHVENKGQTLPFTRGCSFYTLVSDQIKEGVDIKEPEVFKLGGLELFWESVSTNVLQDPIRLVPAVLWGLYVYVVFFSDGILPGANALQFEERTWHEVADLALNFFLVSPLLDLPFSPVVHPMLESVFNLVLSWAALFAGFLSDDRRTKPNPIPMLPVVVVMQFLTSTVLLPYLVTRTAEVGRVKLSRKDLSFPLAESKLVGPFLGIVGAGSIAWGVLGRFDEFGGWAERLDSFGALLSVDRLGSSFFVDLVLFALFQGWLVDDDLKRRSVAYNEQAVLRTVATFVPFFGLAIYMTLRPSIIETEQK